MEGLEEKEEGGWVGGRVGGGADLEEGGERGGRWGVEPEGCWKGGEERRGKGNVRR